MSTYVYTHHTLPASQPVFLGPCRVLQFETDIIFQPLSHTCNPLLLHQSVIVVDKNILSVKKKHHIIKEMPLVRVYADLGRLVILCVYMYVFEIHIIIYYTEDGDDFLYVYRNCADEFCETQRFYETH